MKLLFSEQNSDYENYQFPYAVWAFPEAGETPADIFNAGFLPSSRNLDRFYLCRQVRVNLAKFKPSSENRRILRKGKGIGVELVPREKYDYSPGRREFFKTYADIKFGKDLSLIHISEPTRQAEISYAVFCLKKKKKKKK